MSDIMSVVASPEGATKDDDQRQGLNGSVVDPLTASTLGAPTPPPEDSEPEPTAGDELDPAAPDVEGTGGTPASPEDSSPSGAPASPGGGASSGPSTPASTSASTAADIRIASGGGPGVGSGESMPSGPSGISDFSFDPESVDISGGDAPNSLLGVSPGFGLQEAWGKQADEMCYVTVVPESPLPTQSAVQTDRGPMDASSSASQQDATAGFYTYEQRKDIALSAAGRGIVGGTQSALTGLALDGAGLLANNQGAKWIATGTRMGRVAGGTLSTAVPIIGGALGAVNLYNTFQDFDNKFAAPWGELTGADSTGYERLAGGLELIASVLSVLGDVLGIAAAICAIAGIITAIAGVGFAIGAWAGTLAVIGTGVSLASMVISGIAALVRALKILDSDGNPADVDADAAALEAHVNNSLAQAVGLGKEGLSQKSKSKSKINKTDTDIDNTVSQTVKKEASSASPSGPVNSPPAPEAPTPLAEIGRQPLDAPTMVETPDVPAMDIDVTPPKPIEVDVTAPPPDPTTADVPAPPARNVTTPPPAPTGPSMPTDMGVDVPVATATPSRPVEGPVVPKLDVNAASGGNKKTLSEWEAMGLSADEYGDYSSAFDARSARTSDQVETLQIADLYALDQVPKQPNKLDVEILQENFNARELTRLDELQGLEPTQWKENDKYLLGKKAQVLDHHVVPGQTKVSKVVPDSEVTTLKGFVAMGDTGNNKTGANLVEERGLHYTDGEGKQPYLKADGTPVDDVSVAEATLTQEMYDSRVVPIDDALVKTFQNTGVPFGTRNKRDGIFTGTGSAGDAGKSTLSNEYTIWNGNDAGGNFAAPDAKVHMHGKAGRANTQSPASSAALKTAADDAMPPRALAPAASDGASSSAASSAAPASGRRRPKTMDASRSKNATNKLSPASQRVDDVRTAVQDSSQLFGLGVGAAGNDTLKSSLGLSENSATDEVAQAPTAEERRDEVVAQLPDPTSVALPTTWQTPTYDVTSRMASHPPAGETVSLEPIAPLPYDPASAAHHMAMAAANAGRTEMLAEQEAMLKGMIAQSEEMLSDSGQYAVLEASNDTRAARIADNANASEKVDKTLTDASQKQTKADKETAKAEKGLDQADSGAVGDLTSLVNNSAVRGLVNVGGDIAKAGASVVNFIGSAFTDDDVVDTSTIDDLQRLINAGQKAGGQRSKARSGKGSASSATTDMGAKIDTNQAGLKEAEKTRKRVEGRQQNMEGQVRKQRSDRRSHLKELRTKLNATRKDKDETSDAAQHASTVAALELAGLEAHRVHTENVIASNQQRVSAARAASASGALTGEEQGLVDRRMARAQALRQAATAAIPEVQQTADTARMTCVATNGFELPSRFDAAAQVQIAAISDLVTSHIVPLVDQMMADLGVVTRDRLGATLAAVDDGLQSCAMALTKAREQTLNSVTSIFMLTTRKEVRTARRESRRERRDARRAERRG